MTLSVSEAISRVQDRGRFDRESNIPTFHLGYIARFLLKPQFFEISVAPANKPIERYFTVMCIGSCLERMRMCLHHQNVGRQHDCCNMLKSNIVTSVYTFQESIVRDSCNDILQKDDIIADASMSPPGYLRLTVHEPSYLISSFASGRFLTHPISDIEFFGFKCENWPAATAEWISRDRPSGWPGLDVMKSCLESGCLVIGRAHPLSKSKETEWQYIFSEAERILAVDALTDDMKYCFQIFKILVDFHLRDYSPRLKTTHLKTVMYFACEVVPTWVWTRNTGGGLLYLLQYLLYYLTQNNLPNYFVVDNNMLDGFTNGEINLMRIRVQNIRSFPVMAIVSMAEHHNCPEMGRINAVLDDVETFKKDSNIHRSVQNVFLPDTLAYFKWYIISKEYKWACILLDSAYKLIRDSITEDDSQISIPSVKEFLTQCLAGETIHYKGLMNSCLSKHFGITLDEIESDKTCREVEMCMSKGIHLEQSVALGETATNSAPEGKISDRLDSADKGNDMDAIVQRKNDEHEKGQSSSEPCDIVIAVCKTLMDMKTDAPLSSVD